MDLWLCISRIFLCVERMVYSHLCLEYGIPSDRVEGSDDESWFADLAGVARGCRMGCIRCNRIFSTTNVSINIYTAYIVVSDIVREIFQCGVIRIEWADSGVHWGWYRHMHRFCTMIMLGVNEKRKAC
jgi:hypothetical protein